MRIIEIQLWGYFYCAVNTTKIYGRTSICERVILVFADLRGTSKVVNYYFSDICIRKSIILSHILRQFGHIMSLSSAFFIEASKLKHGLQ